MSDVSETLNNRQATHGDYHEQAELFDALLKTAQTGPKFHQLTSQERGGLVMILQKASRILSGNPHEPDHWHDIAGYATLVERDIHTYRKENTDGTDTGLLGPIVPGPRGAPWRAINPASE